MAHLSFTPLYGVFVGAGTGLQASWAKQSADKQGVHQEGGDIVYFKFRNQCVCASLMIPRFPDGVDASVFKS